MEQYIKKSALVSEIRKRLLPTIRDKHYDEWEEGQDSERIAILEIIDTLEVKEVDLEREFDIEDAVHGTVDYPLIGHDFPNIFPNYKELKEYCDRKGIKDNDKVKLIIIKDM